VLKTNEVGVFPFGHIFGMNPALYGTEGVTLQGTSLMSEEKKFDSWFSGEVEVHS